MIVCFDINLLARAFQVKHSMETEMEHLQSDIAQTSPRSEHTMDSSTTVLLDGDDHTGSASPFPVQQNMGSSNQPQEIATQQERPAPALTFETSVHTGCITKWLSEIRLEPIWERLAGTPACEQFEVQGNIRFCRALEVMPMYMHGELAGVLQWNPRVRFAWCSMLYGSKEEVQKKMAQALWLGYQLDHYLRRQFPGQELIDFTNVLFIEEGCIDEMDLKALSL